MLGSTHGETRKRFCCAVIFNALQMYLHLTLTLDSHMTRIYVTNFISSWKYCEMKTVRVCTKRRRFYYYLHKLYNAWHISALKVPWHPSAKALTGVSPPKFEQNCNLVCQLECYHQVYIRVLVLSAIEAKNIKESRCTNQPVYSR